MKATERPYYLAVGDEDQVFKAAYRQGLAVVLKGPTGCGKTRRSRPWRTTWGDRSSPCRATTT